MSGLEPTLPPKVVVEPVYTARCEGCGMADVGPRDRVMEWSKKHRCEDAQYEF